jgi:hydrogenase nickel incorporation protein HypA/HybF
MHELSLVTALFEQVKRALEPHPGASVSGLVVRIGELSGVDPDLFRSAYDTVREATDFPAAELSLDVEQAAWACPSCDIEIARGTPLQCRRCGAYARLARGGDVFLDRIEAEVPNV